MTTLTISERTHRMVKKLKEREGASSFDELLKKIAEERMGTPSSEEMFGSMEIDDKEDIRDHDDRVDRYD
jgi:predicted CopG family antitoxin